ncbi:MAG TPA: methylenetetrahydrofolate reductase [NAD(P)H] [Polyangiales bacterium]|nr:methylenetetrahydrofolate reductase [NAD(P)H] [Polyangiales bacterium]
MRIADLYAEGRPVLSLEFFTPKNAAGRRALWRAIERLSAIDPGFVSITCGAAGTTRERTADLAIEIQRTFGIPTMAHLVCTGTTKAELDTTLRHMHAHGIDNVLALRGDPPRGAADWKPVEGGFRYASELTGFVRAGYSLGIGGACYPEKHHEAPSLEADIRNLKRKVEAGAEFLITQLFFDNDKYWSFVEAVRAEGIGVPIVPGIMPVLNLTNLQRIASLSPGTSVPDSLEEALRKAGDDDEAALQAGVEFAADQCRALLKGGAPGLHFYTLNRSKATLRTVSQLQRDGLIRPE